MRHGEIAPYDRSSNAFWRLQKLIRRSIKPVMNKTYTSKSSLTFAEWAPSTHLQKAVVSVQSYGHIFTSPAFKHVFCLYY